MRGIVDTVVFKPVDWFAPLKWEDTFALAQPVEIDVGCGKGAFLLWAARTRPQSNFLGIERQFARLRKVDKKIQRLGLDNVRLIRVEAGYLIGKLVPADSVAAYHIFFPDPWPKRRHAAHRLFQPEFVADVHRTLRQGGAVNVATDDPTYFLQIQSLMKRVGQFDEVAPERLPEEAMTEFERVFRQKGQPIFRSRYVRQDQ
jgi:tRNA (guanine-N7-)-methyltransferase